MRTLRAVLLLSFALGLPRQGATQQHAHGKPDPRVGGVTFPTSCSATAQPHFERAVAMLHSFWFPEAQKSFELAAAADPKCGLAHWGVAMTLLGNPYTGVEPAKGQLAQALAAARKGVELTANATQRERDYAATALALYLDHETVPFRSRLQAHEAALKVVHERNPRDDEAAIFHARAMIANAPPKDLTFARQKAAAAILEPLFVKMPKHPGLAHYIIHANDSPSLASHALDAARSYADIAPDAPHALHMPSHIFTRLGYWDESIATNIKSANAEPVPTAAVHPMDYMVYAFLQQGRDAEAHAVVSQAVQLPDRFYGGIIGYNFAAMPARYALERGKWEDAARLAVPTGVSPYVTSLARFARAIGAARSKQLPMAREEVAALATVRDTLAKAGDTYWATVADAQRLAASAWIALGEGRAAEAVTLARQGAELEETVEKHPVTPGPLLPARELLGDMLLELKRPAEALTAYEATLTREPNRARALFGAARAAELSGNEALARKRYGELASLMKKADVGREEAGIAKAFLAKRK